MDILTEAELCFVQEKKTRNDRISTYESLKEKILSRELPEGVPIPQTRLIEEYHYGRTPLREALYQLSEEGLVKWEQNRRIMIEPLRAEEIDQISSIRIMLDSFAVRYSVPQLKEDDFAVMRGYLQKMAELTASGTDENELRKTHALFHAALHKNCGAMFEKEFYRINQISERYRRKFKQLTNNYDVSVHEEMLRAAEAGQSEFVGSLVANHYAKTSLKVISEIDPLYEPTFIRQALKVVVMSGGYDGRS